MKQIFDTKNQPESQEAKVYQMGYPLYPANEDIYNKGEKEEKIESLNQNKQNSQSMLGQKTGSMLDKKTNQDFNNEHPNHNDSGLIVDGSAPDGTKTKQIPDKKKFEINLKNNKQ